MSTNTLASPVANTLQPAPQKRKVSKATRREHLEGYLFISPWCLGFLAFTLGPLVAAIYLSLTNYDLVSSPSFVGLANYRRMLVDPLVPKSLWLTAIYAFTTVFLRFIVGLTLALALNRGLRGTRFFRTAFYMPSVVTGVAVGIMWKWFFHAEFGAANALLDLVGIRGPSWLGTTTWALPTMILLTLWDAGRPMIMYLAGLQGVPSQLYEAATMDGANAIDKFFHVTLPMLSPVILYQFIMGIIGSFQVFTIAFVTTQGGPGNSTLFLVLYIYQQGFRFMRMGYASALAEILFVIVLIVTILVWTTSARVVYYEGELAK